LGKVIIKLAHQEHLAKKKDKIQITSSQSYIPFRESKLTRLLQDSIGGNTMTYLIATISPTEDNAEESISTIRFAERASMVVQKVKKNEFSAKDDALIHKLQNEINYLKELLQLKKKGKEQELTNQLYLLKQENKRLKMNALTNQQVENMMKENKEMRI
jgi:hypothetical protein